MSANCESRANPHFYEICLSKNAKINIYDLKGNELVDELEYCDAFGVSTKSAIVYSRKDLIFDIYSLDGEEVSLKIAKYNRTTGKTYIVDFDNLEISKNGKAMLLFSPKKNPKSEIGIYYDHDGFLDRHRLPDYFEFK